ncbi:DUF4446 family protein [Marinitenerispora sediminis]|uniref:DUF4446 family protein n=1 Tax=Marinitenerispora sediminis TaxID=1931232 RepID=UPI0015F1A808|nr:DUF4446 family protein [Marinitenerispora sediminis]
MLSTILAGAAVLLGVVGLLLGVIALIRSRRAVDDCRTELRRLLPDANGVDVRAIRDVAAVRYDALEEMSGARSFSLAMLNAAGDGVVLTSINGRTESRTYAKIVEQGSAAEALSPEEYRAIRAARLGQGPGYATPLGDSVPGTAAYAPARPAAGAVPEQAGPERPAEPAPSRVGEGAGGERTAAEPGGPDPSSR